MVQLSTGGASGIGQTATAELEQYGRPTRAAIVDVSDSGQVDGAMEAVANDLGRVDIVVANAGIGGEQMPASPRQPFGSMLPTAYG